MTMTLDQMETEVRRLRAEIERMKNGGAGNQVQPGVNIIGQSLQVNGNLLAAGNVAANSYIATSAFIDAGGNLPGSNGWAWETRTPTYSSGTAMIFSGVDLTGFYFATAKIAFFQAFYGVWKFAYVASSTYSGGNTTVNIVGDALRNEAITGLRFSYAANQPGFPQWFTNVPALTGYSGSPSSFGQFAIENKVCQFYVSISGQSSQTYLTVSLPISASNGIGFLNVQDVGGAWNQGLVSCSGGFMTVYKDAAGNPFSNSGTKSVRGLITYLAQ